MRVIVRRTTQGTLTFAADEPVELIMVDEKASDDRCFRFTPNGDAFTIGRKAVDEILGNSRIGWTGDESKADLDIKTLAHRFHKTTNPRKYTE
jgi:hypothetical protein